MNSTFQVVLKMKDKLRERPTSECPILDKAMTKSMSFCPCFCFLKGTFCQCQKGFPEVLNGSSISALMFLPPKRAFHVPFSGLSLKIALSNLPLLAERNQHVGPGRDCGLHLAPGQGRRGGRAQQERLPQQALGGPPAQRLAAEEMRGEGGEGQRQSS